MEEFEIRPATREDVPLILQFIRDLAEYEKLLSEVRATEAGLENTLFEKKGAEVLNGGYSIGMNQP